MKVRGVLGSSLLTLFPAESRVAYDPVLMIVKMNLSCLREKGVG